ncbi:cytochrome P450 4F12-like isoform X4 [Babylonia areolata]|uniref:cytochrome P450 4F12-like isoform X4 n=1 Tax=Babylonia areolata TaxID=304850 RepID=UPI003FD3F6AC
MCSCTAENHKCFSEQHNCQYPTSESTKSTSHNWTATTQSVIVRDGNGGGGNFAAGARGSGGGGDGAGGAGSEVGDVVQGLLQLLQRSAWGDQLQVDLGESAHEPKPGMYRFGEPWLGLGLLLANGDRWARSRRLLTPAFHFDILKPYVAISNAAVEKFIERISDHVKEGGNFEAFSLVSLCTLDVILQCAMSYKDDIQNKGETHPYVQAVKELSELWFERGRNPLLYNDFVYSLTSSGRRFKQHCAFVHSLSETIIRTRRKILAKEGISKKRNLDFLDILLTAKDETGQGLTSLEIRNEVDTFLFEGHDTTASAISWILFSLAGHPQCQTRAQAEVDEILEGRDRPDLEWGDLSKLEYLTQVIKEGMRLHCPVPFIQRQLTKPVTIEGVMLPVGTFCTIHLQNLHHNPVVWKDPWTFDPDRFHPDNLKDKDTYAFVPFSAGPRNCIGQHFAMNEEKVVLGRLLHKFTFTLDPSHVVKKKASVVMRAENGIKLFATPRR